MDQTDETGEGLVQKRQPGGIETQLTSSPKNHFMLPFGPFSPDDGWVVYDTRAAEPFPKPEKTDLFPGAKTLENLRF